MIHIIHGKDAFRVRRAVAAIREDLRAGDDMLDTNTTLLDGSQISAPELVAHCATVPFLGGARLVIVEGLFKHLGEQRRGRRPKKAAPEDPLEPWRIAASQLADAGVTPPTTTLVFVEGELTTDKMKRVTNPAFALFAPMAQVEAFEPLSGGELASWIRDAGDTKGVNLAPRAVAALSQLAGSDLWALDNELEKLAAYAGGALVDEKMIAEVVSAAQQAKVWDLTDAIVEGNARKASAGLQRLLREGEPPTLIAFMIARQFRQIALVKDMRTRRMRQDEIEKGVGITTYRLKAVGDLAGRYSWGALRRAYGLLLESDLSVKRGIQNDEAALDLLVNQLCALAPRASGRAGYRPAAASA